MTIHLTTVPGFADVPDASLSAENPALGVHLSRITSNAAFGMCRLEVFVGLYKDGDTVSLPISAMDGYAYSPNELIYCWGIWTTANLSTGWITGPDSLWYAAWLVNQNTGLVSTLEWYRRSGDHDNAQQSNDGELIVFTIAQRQKSTLLMTSSASYTDVADSSLVTDAAYTQGMAQQLNKNAKFAALNSEVVYMGEFYGGQTVPVSHSPVDGYVYSRAQVKLIFSWRWTAQGSAFAAPDKALGQLGPIKASIDSTTGIVSASVGYIPDENTVTTHTDHGRLAVFALCSRNNLLGTYGAIANSFAEQDQSLFFPGSTLRASTLLQLNKNIREAAVSAEFFTSGQYKDGQTIPIVTSAVDGYVYARDEMFYVWEWSDTTNATGTHIRVPIFYANIASTGAVSVTVWRLPPGGPYVAGDPTKPTISVTVIAIRGATHTVPTGSGSSGPGSGGTFDNNPPDISPYSITLDMGDGLQPIGSQSLLKHVVSGNLTSVTLPSGLSGSVFKSRVAFTSSYVITITKNGSSIGTINFAAGASTATFTFSAAQTLVPGDVIGFDGQSSADATGSGIYGTLSGTRN